MTKAPIAILCSTLDDPHAVLLDDLSVSATTIKLDYTDWVVRTTGRTDKRVVDKLRELHVTVITPADDNTIFVKGEPIENDHLITLKHGLESVNTFEGKTLQYIDGDRVIMAAKYFPNDLAQLAQMAMDLGQRTEEKGYINVRRTRKDFLDHHPPLTDTEHVFNDWYSKVFGMPIDIGGTVHIMTPDIVEAILTQSPQLEPISFPHPLWLIIAKKMGAVIESDEIQNVLTYEAPEQNRSAPEVQTFTSKDSQTPQSPAERYAQLQEAYRLTLGTTGPQGTMSTTEWAKRFGTERAYLQLLLNHLDSLMDPDETEIKKEYRSGITQAIESITTHGETISTLLSQPPKETDRIQDALDRIGRLMEQPQGRTKES